MCKLNLREVHSQDHRSFGRKLDSKGYMDSHLSNEDTISVNMDLRRIKRIKWNHKGLKQGKWIKNFSLSYDIYNHYPKGYEWTNLMGGYLNNVNKWNHKEPYFLETIFFNQLKGRILALSSLKNEGHIVKDV